MRALILYLTLLPAAAPDGPGDGRARPRSPQTDYMPGWVVPQNYRAKAPAAAEPGPARAEVPARPVRTRVFPADAAVRRTQDANQPPRTDLPEAIPPGASMPAPGAAPAPADSGSQGMAIGLQAALYGTLTNNPDLVTLRNSNIASPEAVEVARRFPTTLNPTLWVDYRPINIIPPDTFGTKTPGTTTTHSKFGQQYFYLSLRQPIELGHQTTHRYEIAKAALNQQQWTVVQAELLALVQTYRFFQTAAYRREKLRIANELADFNDRLMESLKKRLEANQVAAADVVLGSVENRATRQQVEVASQDYAIALADLRNQLGQPETANTAEPLGALVIPAAIPEVDEASMVQMALRCRPDVHVARAQAAGAHAAVNLARGDRIPTPVVGPLYQRDEVGVQYVGLVYITPIPVLNNGKPLVIQREAEHRRTIVALRQIEQRAVTQVRAAVAKWNAANRLVNQTVGLTASLRDEVARMDRLFQDNQADLTKLLQARQRLIQLQNAELDAVWQATQAQADLLTALGAPGLIAALNAPAPVVAPSAVGPSSDDAKP